LSAINAQLLSHGWTKRPLNLSALDEKNHTDVVTVLFELLGTSVVCTFPSNTEQRTDCLDES